MLLGRAPFAEPTLTTVATTKTLAEYFISRHSNRGFCAADIAHALRSVRTT